MRTREQQQAELAALREKFPVGSLVELTREFNRMPKGVTGVVIEHFAPEQHPWGVWLAVTWMAHDDLGFEEAELCLERKNGDRT